MNSARDRAALSAVLLVVSLNLVAAGPAVPGYVNLAYEDTVRQRPLAVKLWYPAAGGTSVAPMSYEHAWKGLAVAGAPYRADAKPMPLVLLSHGDRGSNLDQSWLAEALAANGYLVASVAHWKNTWNDNEPEATLRAWERPQDGTAVLDRLLSDEMWRARVDESRIAAAGHSSGGYTALALAGAVYAPMQMSRYCASHESAADCALAGGAVGRIDFSKAGASYRDQRVRAVFAMAPALGPGIDEASLRAIALPVAIVYAADDEVLRPPELHARRYAAAVPGARVVELPRGGHFGFMPECTWVTRTFTFFKTFDICGRKTDVDRAALHATVAYEALAFLSASLPPRR
jgi:predicted dienelactone hydrolase